MGTKTLTITNEAYERLAAFKEKKESFSDVVNKLTSRTSLLSLVGVLSKEEAGELRKNVIETRKRLRGDMDKIAARL